jgi:hypothetical protein
VPEVAHQDLQSALFITNGSSGSVEALLKTDSDLSCTNEEESWHSSAPTPEAVQSTSCPEANANPKTERIAILFDIMDRNPDMEVCTAKEQQIPALEG